MKKSNYVLAIDVAKGKSMFYIQSVHGEVLLSPIEYEHLLSNFRKIDQFIKEEEIKRNTTVFLESTSSYHYPVERFFLENGYQVLTVNPNIIKKSKTNLRKTKTDSLDCLLIAECYFKESFKSNSLKTHDIYDDLCTIHRQFIALEASITKLKNRYVRLLDICIPCHNHFYGSSKVDPKKKYEEKYLQLFYHFPHVDILSSTRADRIATIMNNVFKLNHRSRLTVEANMIKGLCRDSYAGVSKHHAEVNNLKQVISILLTLIKLKDEVRDSLIEKAMETPYYKNISSIPGIGEISTSQLIAELGDISRFENYKQVTAYLGLDPVLYQSGKINKMGSISKVGNKTGRKVIYTSIKNITRVAAMHDTSNPIYITYLRKAEKKSKKYATVACSTKLIRLIFSLCINNTLYDTTL